MKGCPLGGAPHVLTCSHLPSPGAPGCYLFSGHPCRGHTLIFSSRDRATWIAHSLCVSRLFPGLLGGGDRGNHAQGAAAGRVGVARHCVRPWSSAPRGCGVGAKVQDSLWAFHRRTRLREIREWSRQQHPPSKWLLWLGFKYILWTWGRADVFPISCHTSSVLTPPLTFVFLFDGKHYFKIFLTSVKERKIGCSMRYREGLPRWLSGKEFTCQCRRHRKLGFDPWVRKVAWRREWQPTPVFLPGKSHGQRSLVGYSPWGHKESERTEHACMYVWGTESSLGRCEQGFHFLSAYI